MKILTASLINKYILNNPNSLQMNSNKYIDQNISENNLMYICYIIISYIIKIKSNKLYNVQGTLTYMFMTIFLDMKISKIQK